MKFTEAAETKEILFHSLYIWPAVKSLSVHIVRELGQWPDKHGECDCPCAWVFTPSEPNRHTDLQLSGDFSVRVKLPRTQADSSSSVCCPVCCRVAAFFQTGRKHVGQSRMIPSWVGSTENTSAVLPLQAVCSLLLSSRPPTDTLLTNACCVAQISRHSANLHDQLLCVPFSISFVSLFVSAFL